MPTPLEATPRHPSTPGRAAIWATWVGQALAFFAGAWQGYGFGVQVAGPVAGPWLGTLAALNLGVLAAVAVGSLADGWRRRRSRR